MVISVLVTFSSVFYYEGLLFFFNYARFLGIPSSSFEYSYNHIFLTGLMEYFPVILILPFFVDRFNRLWQVRKSKKEIEFHLTPLSKIREEIGEKKIQTNSSEEQERLKLIIAEAEKTDVRGRDLISKIEEIEQRVLRDWDSWPVRWSFLAIFFSFFVGSLLSPDFF